MSDGNNVPINGPNPVTMQIDEAGFDRESNKQNANIVSTEDGDFVNISIRNLIDSEYIVYNQNEKNYATSIDLRIPRNRQMTPIQLKGVNAYKMNSETPAEPAIMLPFGTMTEATANEEILLEKDQDAILISPNQTEICHITNTDPNAVDGQITRKKFNLFEGAKYYIFKATEIAEAIGKLSCTIYDTYNKITLGLPKWVLPAILPVVSITEENGVQTQEMADIMSFQTLKDHYITLPRNMYTIQN